MSTNNNNEVAGEPTKTTFSLLETASAAIQNFAPVNKIHQHLCAFHFYSDDMTRQVEAHHFCGHQNEEMRQCLIYDSNETNAKLIGLEYIISDNLFFTLPDQEKPLWHSHEYEVKSGFYFLPGIPAPIEYSDLEKVCKTYGCAKRMGVDFEKERKEREYMTGPTHGVHPLANGGGKGLKTVLREVELKHDELPHSANRVFV
ncbi:unnamed protein product [Lupinus luteus]|uniref:Uncharacterized protein n=1 Tax=Lupinus luteus TaxID=3873 RepID=A0AAV1YGN8_LUPLU